VLNSFRVSKFLVTVRRKMLVFDVSLLRIERR